MTFLAHLSISYFYVLTLIMVFMSRLLRVFVFGFMIYEEFSHSSRFASSSYLDTLLRMLNRTEKEGAIDQRISVVHQHHFLAQNARHVRFLVCRE